jgi:hypothetical protein
MAIKKNIYALIFLQLKDKKFYIKLHMKQTNILFNYKEDNYLDYQNQIESNQNTVATQPNNTTDTQITPSLTTINKVTSTPNRDKGKSSLPNI